MEIKKIRRISPGDHLDTSTNIGTLKNTAYIYGDLISIGTRSFINTKSTRYIPQVDDTVIGKVIYKSVDNYKLDLGQGLTGFLPALNFPNATKRNKPDLEYNDNVMARIVRLKDVPVLFCDEGMGKIGGYVFNVGVYLVRKVIVEDVLAVLGEKIAFSVGIGLNGKIWIASDNILDVRHVYTSIIALNELNSEVDV